MAILRSRTAADPLAAPPSSSMLERAVGEVAQRQAQAREEGRAAALAELGAKLKQAEQRAADAEKTVEAAVAARTQQLEARLAKLLEGLADSAKKIEELQAQTVRACENDVVRLALAISAKVLAHAVDTDPQWMTDAVSRALNQIPDRRVIALRMHPADAGLVRERHRELSLAAPHLGRLDIVDDAALEPGSIVLTSLGTTLDVSLPGAWERLGMHLLQAAPNPACTVEGDAAG